MIPKKSGATQLVLGAAICFGIAYAGWGFANRVLNEQAVVLNTPSQVGYCIAVKMTAAEKQVVAESLMRPVDAAQVGRLMPFIISGEVTDEKKAPRPGWPMTMPSMQWSGRRPANCLTVQPG